MRLFTTIIAFTIFLVGTIACSNDKPLPLDPVTNAFQDKGTSNEAEALFEKGLLCNQRGEHQQAIKYYEQSNAIKEDWATYDNLALSKSTIGQVEEAILDFNRSIKLNPKNPDAFYNRGNSKAILQDYHGAIDDYTTAIELNPKYAIAYQNRGVTRVYYLKDKQNGCTDLFTAKELGAKGVDNDIKTYCN